MRRSLIITAVIGIVAGAWIAIPDLLAGSPSASGRLRLAAQIGAVRSDLWTKVAEQTSGLGPDLRRSLDQNAASHETGVVWSAEHRALRTSPLLSKAWLLLSAAMTEGEEQARVEPALTMAFFTGPGEAFEVPLRLTLAGQHLALTKPELCDLLRPDARFETRLGAPGTAILSAAFNLAAPDNGPCIESLVPGVKKTPPTP